MDSNIVVVERQPGERAKPIFEGGARYEYESIPTTPTQPPPRPSEREGGVTTAQEQQREHLWLGGCNLAKAMLGIGVLALPKVTAVLGLSLSLSFLVLVALLTYASLHYLTVASSRSGVLRYSDVVREHTGLVGQTLLDASLIVNSAGVLIIALIILADILVGDGNNNQGLLSEACGSRQTVLAVVCVILIVPLVSVTRLRSVAGASALGVAAILFWAALTVLLFVVAWSNGALHHMYWWPRGRLVGHGFESAVQVLATLPIILVAFTVQMSLQHTLRDLQYVSDREVDRVSAAALVVSTVAYAAISISSYGLFGSQVEADVLRSFTVKALRPIVYTRLAHACFTAVRLGFLVSLITIFPLHMAPLRDALWMLLFRQELTGPGLWVVTYALLAGLYCVAIWIDSIWGPLLLIGSTAGALLALVFPGLLAIRTPEMLTEAQGARGWRILGGSILILFGLLAAVVGILRLLLYKDPLDG